MDDLKEDVDADDTDVTVTITSVDVPPASDDTDDGDDVDGPTPDDAVVTHARTSTDPDVPNFRVDPDDVRDRLADDPPANPTLSDFYSDGLEACGAPTTDGTPCRRPIVRGVGRCEVHLPDEDGFADGTH
jgi:hypothetical protein